MGEATTQRLTLEFEPGEPIAGWAQGESVPRHRFDGLLELIALLEQVRSATDGLDRVEDSS